MDATDIDRLVTAARMLDVKPSALAALWLTETINAKLAPGGDMNKAQELYDRLRKAKSDVLKQWKAETGGIVEE